MAGIDGERQRPALGIVADDLTGAGDSAVKFAEAGWTCEIALADVPALAPGTAVALVTDARSMSDADASGRTRAAVETLANSGTDLQYLKIDSTLRGTVSAQIGGALEALSARAPDAFALVCPAYPAMGRTVECGRLLVHGEAAVGRHGEAPAVPGAVSVTLGDAAPAREADRLRALARESRVLLLDAASDADLDRVAAVAEELGPSVLLVGSAGLAAALARRHAGCSVAPGAPTALQTRSAEGGSIVVAVSSTHPVSASQVAALGSHVVVITAPAEDVLVDGVRSERAAAANVAEAVEVALAAGGVRALVLVGGDGALAVLARLGAHGVRVGSAVVEGVPAGTVRGGALDGLTVVTKSGGFGHPGTLRDVIDRLEASDHPMKKRTE
ncbi:four-carbon acid sugar kinase family protein [Gryllotalpicola daejeonensis]|uniref:Four-carbon acid sugar kinase family protein n=1 Tax=Gryllotalpicola daejeonensis TaxID=993087 RepID=A0ABP7ZNH7_9MICO